MATNRRVSCATHWALAISLVQSLGWPALAAAEEFRSPAIAAAEEIRPSDGPEIASGSHQVLAPEDQDDPFWEKNSIFPAPQPDPDWLEKLRLGHERELLSTAHLFLGGATLGMLTGAGVTGAMLIRENDPTIRFWHQALVGAGTAAYFIDGALILLAPKPYRPEAEETEFSNIVLHRGLFYLHLAGMTSAVFTGLVATRFWGLDPTLDIRRTHPALGTAAIGLIAASALAITLNF